MATHEVFNQSGPLSDLDLFGSDRALVEALAAEAGASGRAALAGVGDAASDLSALGRKLGAAETLHLGRLANDYPPVLHAFDRFGRRIDEIEFHPAWHELMAMLIGEGMQSATWSGLAPGRTTLPAGSSFDPLGPDTQLLRAAKYLLFSQVENGTQCPITMTWASIPVIAKQPALVADWLPKLLSRQYDPRSAPLAERGCALIGMGMTEKQGGSDVRSNSTRADPVPLSDFGDRWGAPYRLTGHKWFMSAPMSDGFLVLARVGATGSGGDSGNTPGEAAGEAAREPLSCFLVPRWLPDGTRNAVLLQRLKDKLGNRSNASSEVEFDRTAAFLVGEPGRGIATILEMGSLTRFDCAVASAGIMRRAVAEALHHASHRVAFGSLLADQPLMRNVLADLALESEAAMRWALRLARALDERQTDPLADALLRVGTPLAKYWICRRGPALAFETMEVLGGNGYVEEAPLARLYRELPVNSIWEGSGNVMCLDLLRALDRQPACREALLAELTSALGRNPLYDRFVAGLFEAVGLTDPAQARRLAGDLARAWQAALMLRSAPAEVAAAFCAARLDDSRAAGDQAFGTLPAGIDLEAIVVRAMPRTSSN